MNLSKKILEKIEKEKIIPKPRYSFLVKNYLVWAGAGLAIFLGLQSVAIIIYLIKSQDWDIYNSVSNKGEFLILSIPYFWVISLVLFIFITYYNVKHTKSGYKYKFSTILLGYFILTLVLGAGAYTAGLGENLENIFTKKIPFYEKMMHHRFKMWENPQDGRLIGKIVDVQGNKLIIKDFNRKKWIVDTSSTTLPNFIEFRKNMMIKMFGKELKKGEFKAIMIRPDLPKHLIKQLPPPDFCKMKEIGDCARNIR